MAKKKEFKGLERVILLCGGKEDLEKRTRKWAKLVDEDWGEITNKLTYYGLDSRNILEPKVQQLCAISALTAMGGTTRLNTHIKWAFNAGSTEAEIKEAIIQTTRYCGLPFVNDAFDVFAEVMKERATKQ